MRSAGSRASKVRCSAAIKGTANLLVGLILAERVDGPDGGRNPADECDLQNQADDAGKGSANGEELKPGNEDGKDQSHTQLQVGNVRPILPQALHEAEARFARWRFRWSLVGFG